MFYLPVIITTFSRNPAIGHLSRKDSHLLEKNTSQKQLQRTTTSLIRALGDRLSYKAIMSTTNPMTSMLSAPIIIPDSVTIKLLTTRRLYSTEYRRYVL